VPSPCHPLRQRTCVRVALVHTSRAACRKRPVLAHVSCHLLLPVPCASCNIRSHAPLHSCAAIRSRRARALGATTSAAPQRPHHSLDVDVVLYVQSMVRRTLGVPGSRVASAAYLFLHYTLLVAYIARAGVMRCHDFLSGSI
jgi:hypothetical protein